MKYLILGIASSILLMNCNNEDHSTNINVEQKQKIKVETAVAELAGNIMSFNYSGLITPLVSTQLSFRIPGTIQKINVDEGDKVRRGQVLAELDKSSFESSYKAASAIQNQAQDAYDRLKSVYEKGSLPDIKWEEIKSKLEQANSTKQIAKNNLNNCSLKAPSNGVIGSRNMEIGTSAVPGISNIDLVTINDVYVKISVPENEINKIKKDQSANIVIPAINQNEIEGRVEKIGVMANLISKTYEVKIRISNKELKFKPGMVCDVNLNVQNKNNTITIPSQAVIKAKDNKNYVFLIDQKSSVAVAKKHEVTVGEFLNNNLSILYGIKQGDIVVINGQHKLGKNSYVVF